MKQHPFIYKSMFLLSLFTASCKDIASTTNQIDQPQQSVDLINVKPDDNAITLIKEGFKQYRDNEITLEHNEKNGSLWVHMASKSGTSNIYGISIKKKKILKNNEVILAEIPNDRAKIKQKFVINKDTKGYLVKVYNGSADSLKKQLYRQPDFGSAVIQCKKLAR